MNKLLLAQDLTLKCPKCDGLGKFKYSSSFSHSKCPDCKGTGQREMKASDVPLDIQREIVQVFIDGMENSFNGYTTVQSMESHIDTWQGIKSEAKS